MFSSSHNEGEVQVLHLDVSRFHYHLFRCVIRLNRTFNFKGDIECVKFKFIYISVMTSLKGDCRG